MHPVTESPSAIRLTIRGRFWDSQLYSGSLYLFGVSGELWTVDWDKLVAGIPIPDRLRIAADLALLGNQKLYEIGAQFLLRDTEIHELLKGKFRDLGLMPVLEVALPDNCVRGNPLPFPHNDSEVHYQRLYVGASDGLYAFATAENHNSNERLHLCEAPALRIAAKLRTMAQAAGTDGLFAVRLSGDSEPADGESPDQATHVSHLPCTSCEWAFNSVVASGYDNSIYLAPFDLKEPQRNGGTGRRSTRRRFDRIIPDEEIFQTGETGLRGFSWGAGDRLFRFNAGHVNVITYKPPRGRNRYNFRFKGDITLDATETFTDVVAARAAPFGSVIEKDDSLLILLSTGLSMHLDGEPTNWRIFPRSRNYVNQLHVIYRDRLDIWAFTHDYFVDQEEKLSGIGGGASE
jgi:hypothetical protein